MSKNRSSALKRDREARKREKHALKVQRRDDRKRGDLPPDDTQPSDTTPENGEIIPETPPLEAGHPNND